MARVLVVDDDPALLRALRVSLHLQSHEVLTAATGEQGISQAASASPDVIVLDLGLPDIDGLTVCRRIREWDSVPIIVLSAIGSEDRKVAALDYGADDYMTKPFGVAELEARIRTAIRHHQSSNPATTSSTITLGPLELDLVHREAHLGERPLELTARELELLAFLARHSGKILYSRDDPGRGVGQRLCQGSPVPPRVRTPAPAKARPNGGVAIKTNAGIGYVLAPTDLGEGAVD